MCEFQYQNSTKWWCHQWLGLHLLKPRSLLVIIPKDLKSSFIKFGSRNQKFFMFKFRYQNGKKQKSKKTFFGLQNRAIMELQIGTGFRARWITIRVRFRDFKSEKKGFKSGQGLQIGAGIINWCRTQIMYYTKDLQKTFHLNYNLFNFNK